jgi:nicotinate-nucleotide pyrophosphorylase (carboxylating)
LIVAASISATSPASFAEVNETLEQALARNVREALAEDIGQGDWTARLIPADQLVQAHVIVRDEAVTLCGVPWFEACVHALGTQAQINWHAAEGGLLKAHQVVCSIQAQARALLSAERAALNFLQLLSATATQTRRFVDAIKPYPHCVVLDTRKTIPGLRQAQKYAVRVGGGHNQRMALWHGILIKENHIAAAGGIAAALQQAQALKADVDIQIEVENLFQLEEALACGAQSVMLDNFDLETMHKAVALNAGRALLEVSGGVQLDTVKDIAATGVSRISVGCLTKDVKAVDFSMRF